MKSIPFIKTMLNEEYRLFISQTFYHEIIPEKFQDWQMKDMIGWNKLINYNSNATIEFYGHGNPYKIKNPDLVNGSELTIPYPNTIDDFICDCERSLVNLNWNDSVISSMNRIFFMKQTEIEKYNIELLTKIEKI